MVNVWIVWVFVRHFSMHMPVSMRLITSPRKVVIVVMVNIMRMTVLMAYWIMMVLMLMAFCQMQPNTKRHQTSS